MDFLERIFHLSPDGGSGLTEFAVLVSILLATAVVPVFRLLLVVSDRSSRSSQLDHDSIRCQEASEP